MNKERPKLAPAWRSESGRMRNDPMHGEWVKLADYTALRSYALALESRLRQLAPSEVLKSAPENE